MRSRLQSSVYCQQRSWRQALRTQRLPRHHHRYGDHDAAALTKSPKLGAADSSKVDLDKVGDMENGGGGNGAEGANRGKAEPRASINTRFILRSIKEENLHQGGLLPPPPPSPPPFQHSHSLWVRAKDPKHLQDVPTLTWSQCGFVLQHRVRVWRGARYDYAHHYV